MSPFLKNNDTRHCPWKNKLQYFGHIFTHNQKQFQQNNSTYLHAAIKCYLNSKSALKVTEIQEIFSLKCIFHFFAN